MIFLENSNIIKYSKQEGNKRVCHANEIPQKILEEIKEDNDFYKQCNGEDFVIIIYEK